MSRFVRACVLTIAIISILSGIAYMIYADEIEQHLDNQQKEEQLAKYEKQEKAEKAKAAEKAKEIKDEKEREKEERKMNAIPKDKDKIVGKLSIESVDINEPVYAGEATNDQLKKGLAFIEEDENMLDQNVSIAGHTFANGPKKDFTKLKETKKGDEVHLSVNGNTHKYKITKSRSVKPDETSVLDDKDNNDKQVLTLITCDDYDEKTDKWLTRSVYTAEKVS